MFLTHFAAVGVVLVYATATWIMPGPRPLNARTWFKGPRLQELDTETYPDAGPGASMSGKMMDGSEPPLPVPIGV